MNHRYNLRPRRPFNASDAAQDSLAHIFSSFSLIELCSLRLVCRSWNATIESYLLPGRTQLTLHIACGNTLLPSALRHDLRHLFVDDIAEYERRRAHHAVPETVGEVLTIWADRFRSFIHFAGRFFAANLQSLIIHQSRCNIDAAYMMLHMALASRHADEHFDLTNIFSLISFCTNLHRLSIWLDFNLPRAHSLAGLHRILRESCASTLHQFDFNVLSHNPCTSTQTLTWTIFPNLTRLSLGSPHLTEQAFRLGSLRRNPLLEHLKLARPPGMRSLVPLRRFLDHLTRHVPPPPITTISLMDFGEPLIDLVVTAFPNLRTLTLMDTQFRDAPDFTPRLAEILATLPHLTNLTLINYHLSREIVLTPLPTITNLTMTSSHRFLKHFTTINSEWYPPPYIEPADRGIAQTFHGEDFRQTLFEQFPSLRQLTLVGDILFADQVTEQLQGLLARRLEQLNIFLRRVWDWDF